MNQRAVLNLPIKTLLFKPFYGTYRFELLNLLFFSFYYFIQNVHLTANNFSSVLIANPESKLSTAI